MRRVVVVGGGISGLSAAYRLARCASEGGPALEAIVVEADSRPGGKIRTDLVGGATVEGGPDSFITAKPQAVELVRELGLADRLLCTDRAHTDVYVYARGRLRRLPGGFALMAPSRLWPFLRSDLLTWRGKLRMGLDLVLPAGRGGDASMGDFARRRFGREALETIVQPILGGIYAGDADRLSLQSTFPKFLELEREHGSVIRGLMSEAGTRGARRAAAAHGAAGDDAGSGDSGRLTMFVTLAGGLSGLVDALAARLGPGSLRLNARVRAVERRGDGFRILLEDGTSLEADGVIVASAAFAAARLLRSLDAALAALLERIPFTSSATLTLGYAAASLPALPPGFGLVAARKTTRIVSAATFTSSKFPGRAAPETTLLRCFLGGGGLEAGLDKPDDALIADAKADLERLLGICAEPAFARLFRWPEANPQYLVGHEELLARIDERLTAHPGLELAGASYRGVGIPDCVGSGARAARSLYNHLSAAGAR